MNDNTPATEIQELQHQLESLKCQLIQTQRTAALGELVSTTTHEFNNLLMTILNYAKIGLRHDEKQSRDRAFEKILMASQKAAKITNSVLGMARNRRDDFEPTDLAVVIDHAMILLERELQKYRIEVEIDIEPDLPHVNAIGNQLQQVVFNLIINARQAMLNGGRLIIRLKHNKTKKAVELSVRDFGTGIPKSKLNRIFDPYFTTKTGPDDSGRGGTGVGLSTCRCIMESHGGRIRVESSVGKGTCFTLIFPAQQANLLPETNPSKISLSNDAGFQQTAP